MKNLQKPFNIIILITCLMLYCYHPSAQIITRSKDHPKWTQDYPPFRIAGNLYYVGTYDLACYLITTPKGNILINTGLPGSDTLIRTHIEQLGFKFKNIKLLLTNHVHFDHAGAIQAIKKSTGAKLWVNENDAPVLADGGSSDYLMGGKGLLFEPVKADKLLGEHDTISFGGMQIAVLHHPGHTKGACSFLFNVIDENRSYRVLIANLPSINEGTILSGMPLYPKVGNDYSYTFQAMKNLKFDIWLAAHASQFDLQKKHQPGDAYKPEAFIDQQGYDATLNQLYQVYLDNLKGK